MTSSYNVVYEIVWIMYGFIKSHCPKVVIVTIISPNGNILFNNFQNVCLFYNLKLCDFVKFDQHLLI